MGEECAMGGPRAVGCDKIKSTSGQRLDQVWTCKSNICPVNVLLLDVEWVRSVPWAVAHGPFFRLDNLRQNLVFMSNI